MRPATRPCLAGPVTRRSRSCAMTSRARPIRPSRRPSPRLCRCARPTLSRTFRSANGIRARWRAKMSPIWCRHLPRCSGTLRSSNQREAPLVEPTCSTLCGPITRQDLSTWTGNLDNPSSFTAEIRSLGGGLASSPSRFTNPGLHHQTTCLPQNSVPRSGSTRLTTISCSSKNGTTRSFISSAAASERPVAIEIPIWLTDDDTRVILKRGRNQPRVIGIVVQFMMVDIRMGCSVTCEITIDALRRWFALDDLIPLIYPGDGLAFLILGDTIEEAANHAYLLGEEVTPPHLISGRMIALRFIAAASPVQGRTNERRKSGPYGGRLILVVGRLIPSQSFQTTASIDRRSSANLHSVWERK